MRIWRVYLANGPKLNGPFIPLAVGAYIMAWGTVGVAHVLRGPARAQEASAAEGTPLDRDA